MEDLGPFFDVLASGSPIPGGGSVAALQVGMGAALLSMVCNLTLGRKRFASVQAEVDEILAEAEVIRKHAHRLAGEDATAYGFVSDAMAMPKDNEVERTARTRAIQMALRDAVIPPLTCMVLASRCLELAEGLVDIGNRNAVSDVGVGVLAAQAGFQAARLNVDINLVSIHDDAWVGTIKKRLEALPDPEQPAQRVLARVEMVINGSRT